MVSACRLYTQPTGQLALKHRLHNPLHYIPLFAQTRSGSKQVPQAKLPTQIASALAEARDALILPNGSVRGPCAVYAQSIADIPFLQLVNK
jgi:hypothetical protein